MKALGTLLLGMAVTACNSSHAPPVEIHCGDQPAAGCCQNCGDRACNCTEVVDYLCDSGAWICPEGTLDRDLCRTTTSACTPDGG